MHRHCNLVCNVSATMSFLIPTFVPRTVTDLTCQLNEETELSRKEAVSRKQVGNPPTCHAKHQAHHCVIRSRLCITRRCPPPPPRVPGEHHVRCPLSVLHVNPLASVLRSLRRFETITRTRDRLGLCRRRTLAEMIRRTPTMVHATAPYPETCRVFTESIS